MRQKDGSITNGGTSASTEESVFGLGLRDATMSASSECTNPQSGRSSFLLEGVKVLYPSIIISERKL